MIRSRLVHRASARVTPFTLCLLLAACGGSEDAGSPANPVTAPLPAATVAAAGPIRVDARTVTFPVRDAATTAAPSNALSRDGRTLAVGTPAVDDARVDVYTQQADTWTRVSTLRSPALAAGAGFGAALALSSDGRTLAVGAPGDLSGAADIGADPRVPGSVSSGAVSIYVKDGETWRHQVFIKPLNPRVAAAFGASVALSADGQWLAVGAPEEGSGARGIDRDPCNGCRPASGAVFVYRRDEQGHWQRAAYVKASNADEGDRFGAALSLTADGGLLVVGAPGEDSAGRDFGDRPDDNAMPDQGAAYVLQRGSDGAWRQTAYVKRAIEPGRNRFGSSVAVSEDGRILAIGAPGEASTTRGPSVWAEDEPERCPCQGVVYTFKSGPDSNFTQAQIGDFRFTSFVNAFNAGVGDRFGERVALTPRGGVLAVSAPYEDSGSGGLFGAPQDNSRVDAGAVYLFEQQSRNFWLPWTFFHVKAPEPAAGGRFGASGLSLSAADQLAAGTLDPAAGAGAVVLYTITPPLP